MNIEPILILAMVLVAVAVPATIPVVWRAIGELIRARQELNISSDKMDQRIERLRVLHDELAKYNVLLDNKIELLAAKKLKEDDRETTAVHSNIFADEERREAFLRQSPNYRQLGQLADLTGQHMAMLRRNKWTLTRHPVDLSEPNNKQNWLLLDKDECILAASNSLAQVMLRASKIDQQKSKEV